MNGDGAKGKGVIDGKTSEPDSLVLKELELDGSGNGLGLALPWRVSIHFLDCSVRSGTSSSSTPIGVAEASTFGRASAGAKAWSGRPGEELDVR